MPRSLLIALTGGLLAFMAGCANDDARTAAAEVRAGELAAALAQGEFGALAVNDGAQADLDEALSGMDGLRADVTASEVDVDRDTAAATLTWSWRLRGEPWTYETTAQMTWADESWTIQWSPSIVEPTLVEGEALVATIEPAERGAILGAGDVPLVTERPVVRYGIDKARLGKAKAADSARELARVVGVSASDYASRVKAAGPKSFVEAVVLRSADTKKIDTDDIDAIPGARAVPDTLMLAPTRRFGSPILGRVGPATAEAVEASDGMVRPDEQVGLSGLQARYEGTLAGTPRVVVSARNGDVDRNLLTREPVAGQPLRTTLDPRIQAAAEAALADVGPASAVVVLRPSTGDILAAANGPGSGGYGTATVGQYAPGSTMKVATALALMRAGVAPTDPVPCTDRVVVNGKPFTNYSDYPANRTGPISLEASVANSCNTALISQHARLSDGDLAAAAASLGLGVDHDLGFPAYFGSVPEPGTETAKAAAMIGQGKVLASPLAMATVAASVAEGRTVVPRLLPDYEAQAGAGTGAGAGSDDGGDPAADASAPEANPAAPAAPLTPAEAQALRAMMRAVVTDGTARFLRDVPGPPVGAKTGTAEFGTDTPPQTRAWMIAFQGDLAIAAFVAEGSSGSGTAGPILEQVLSASG